MTLDELLEFDEIALGKVFAGNKAQKMAAATVKSRLLPILRRLKNTEDDARVSIHDLVTEIGCTEKQALATLEKILTVVPSAFHCTCEFMPPVETMMHLLECEIGPITANNLSSANSVCKEIVDVAVRPRFARFLRSSLKLGATERIDISISEMVTFLLDSYTGFAKAQANGLIARAGAYNEGILKRALVNAGVREKIEFEVTGKESNGDMVFYCNSTTPREQLYVEVKSYGARERLLRGLQDLKEPKAGVGFFTQANEFNPKRTQTLLETNALAIYMPRLAIDSLVADSRNRKNRSGSVFYRPLESFVSDMQDFIARGERAFRP